MKEFGEIRKKYVPLIIAGKVSPKEVAEKYGVSIHTVYSWIKKAKAKAGGNLELLKFEANLEAIKTRTDDLTVEAVLADRKHANKTPEELVEVLRQNFLYTTLAQGQQNLEKHADNLTTLVSKTKQLLQNDMTAKDLQSVTSVMKQTSSMLAEVHGYNINQKTVVKTIKATDSQEDKLTPYGSPDHKPVKLST